MSQMQASFGQWILRTSSNFELVLFDRLPNAERRALPNLEDDPELYGILRPRESAFGTLKAVGRETALLLFTLHESGPLPEYVQRSLGAEACEDLVRGLVLDQVLEVRGREGFVSGALALEVLGRAKLGQVAALSQLSLAALHYGASLPQGEVAWLARRLYHYNRHPLSPKWKRLFPGRAAIIKAIAPAVLRRNWRVQRGNSNDPWIHFFPREVGKTDLSQTVFKLYLSPTVHNLARALMIAFDCLVHHDVLSVKIGGTAAGLLRSDKAVAYFECFEDLESAARDLDERLPKMDSHGVPFTAEIARDGLLSWGMDPPTKSEWSGAAGRSWRAWVTHRLALAMEDRSDVASRVDLALERLRVAGIDTLSWTPSGTIWKRLAS